ncbi:hypothetical protein [Caulobacter soli]|uniref:hypothetical protein n=1 Tax=Caulobacter soli TaxID=2708539 RepID=UPI0013EC0812|nr:hypothetical protein [Caulobacter soli]
MGNAHRFVEAIDPRTGALLGPNGPIADFQTAPVLIVLADPGAGKTQLLRSLGPLELYRRASRVIDLPLPAGAPWRIDAIDEAPGESHQAWDRIVGRLEEAGKPQVVLSCRAQDWPGQAVVDDLNDLYGQNAVRVVRLRPLDEAGALAVLQDLAPDPAGFVAEARARGLGDMLKNPNDLTLLAMAVERGWPSGRTEMFDQAMRVALEEANRVHAERRRPETVETLMAPAGWASAAMLIAGQDDTASDGRELASPTGPAITPDNLRAALRTRAFTGTELHRVQPAHRTVAEYLAGRWLGANMTTALAERRVRAMMFSSDGRPPTSLRGLFAWTVNRMAPARARAWVAADPVGLVTHGDLSLLTGGQKLDLLQALDAHYRRDSRLSGLIGGEDRWRLLIDDHTAPRIKALLGDPEVAVNLKRRLLDGAGAAAAPASLMSSFLALALDATAEVNVRASAVQAYRLAGGAPAPILALLQSLNDGGGEDRAFILRSAILRAISPTAAMVAQTLLARRPDDIGGRLAFSFDHMADQEWPLLLDRLLAAIAGRRASAARRARDSERERALARVLSRLLRDQVSAFTDDRLIGLHQAQVLSMTLSKGDRLRLLAVRDANDTAAFKLFERQVVPGRVEDLWTRFNDVFEIDGFLENDERLWPSILALAKTQTRPAKVAALLDCIVHGTFNRPLPPGLEAEITGLLTSDPAFAGLRQALASAPARRRQSATWAAAHAQRDAREQQKVQATLNDARIAVEAARPGLRDWSDQRALAWIGQLSAGYLEGARIGSLSSERRFDNLAAGLGDTLAAAVAADLIAGLPKAKPADDDTRLAALAAIELLHSQDPAAIENADLIPDDLAGWLLRAWICDGRGANDPYSGQDLGPASWPGRLLATRPATAEAGYFAYAGPALADGDDHVMGLHGLAHSAEFAPVRRDWALKLLSACPHCGPASAHELFHALLRDEPDGGVAEAAVRFLADKTLNKDIRARWTALAWLLDPADAGKIFTAWLTTADRKSAWAAIATLRVDHGPQRWRAMSPSQLADLLEALAPRFPPTPTPRRRGGSTNPWDGAEHVAELIGLLTRLGTPWARDRLEGLAGKPEMTAYADLLRQGAISAGETARERELTERDLKAISAGLLGGPAATVADAVATVAAELEDLEQRYRRRGTGWRKFWNLKTEDGVLIADRIKGEPECRNILLDDLEPRLLPFALRAEDATANDDRIDITVESHAAMFPIEVKLDDNPELWTAAASQLSRRYADDYRASGVGIYLAIWTGRGRNRAAIKPPRGKTPTSAAALKAALDAGLKGQDRERVTVVVMDLSRPAVVVARAKAKLEQKAQARARAQAAAPAAKPPRGGRKTTPRAEPKKPPKAPKTP